MWLPVPQMVTAGKGTSVTGLAVFFKVVTTCSSLHWFQVSKVRKVARLRKPATTMSQSNLSNPPSFWSKM